jgi:nucleotide-binding universal stress UspA family protein
MVHVLVPLDGSDGSWAALGYVEERYPDATVTLLHVIDPGRVTYAAGGGPPTAAEQWFHDERDRAEELFATARERMEASEIRTATEVGSPARVIVEFAETEGVDEVVMGSHGRDGVARVLLGSVAETVVRRAPVPVTVAR